MTVLFLPFFILLVVVNEGVSRKGFLEKSEGE
jgi:hypothetical protein